MSTEMKMSLMMVWCIVIEGRRMLNFDIFLQLETHLAEFLASVLTLVQASLQTVFILDASCRWAAVETVEAVERCDL